MKLKLSGKLKITENDVKQQVKDYLNIKGYFHFPILQSLGAYKGIPDRIAIKDGNVLFLEIKAPKGKLSDDQKDFQANVENVGGEYYVIHSLEEIMEVVKNNKTSYETTKTKVIVIGAKERDDPELRLARAKEIIRLSELTKEVITNGKRFL